MRISRVTTSGVMPVNTTVASLSESAIPLKRTLRRVRDEAPAALLQGEVAARVLVDVNS
jgi:hypothetical protein